MTAIIPFNFSSHAIRTINQDGTAWFVLSDITEALGFSRSRDAARALDDDEKGAHIVRTPGGDQEVITINESGVYALTLRSRRPEAKAFRKWVTAEVLPAIRKTGRYEAPQPTTLTPAQQRHVQERVARIVAADPSHTYASVYHGIKTAFRVGTYKDVQARHYPELCAFLGCQPIEGEFLGKAEPIALPPKPSGHTITDEQMYTVWFVCTHFAHLHEIYSRHNLYTHLTALGSRAAIEMHDHFADGMAGGVNRLLTEFSEQFTKVREEMEARSRRWGAQRETA